MPERSKRDVKDLLSSLNIECEVDDQVFTLVSETNPTVKAFLRGEVSFQEALFVENYLSNGFHAGRAAQAANFQGLEAGAYGRVGRSVLKKDAVKRIISRRIASKALRSDEILAEWAEIAKADMSNFLSVQEGEDPLTGAPMSIAVPDMAKADRLGMLHMVKKAKVGNDGSFTFELRDQDKALEQIARHLGMFEKDNTLQIPRGLIELLQQSPEERRETLDQYEAMIEEDED
jgi:hypothetical protein